MKYTVNNTRFFSDKDLSHGRVLSQDGSDFRYLYKEKNYDIKVVSHDDNQKLWNLVVNGFPVKVKETDELDELLNSLGFNKPKTISLKEILAPMPGLVKEILIKQGDEIQVGDNLFVLEAMKMENIIKATGVGIVTEIPVKTGDKVEKAQVLAKL